MNSFLESEETQHSDEEIAGVKQNAKERLIFYKKRFMYSFITFLLSCASTSPFLYGNPLHEYWDSIGKNLLLMSMGIFLVFVYYSALLWGAWKSHHDLKKIYP